MTLSGPLSLAVFALIGFAVGVFHFASLRASVARFGAGAGLGRLLPLYALRIGVTVAVLLAVVQAGAWPLLAAAAGMMVARAAVLVSAKRQA